METNEEYVEEWLDASFMENTCKATNESVITKPLEVRVNDELPVTRSHTNSVTPDRTTNISCSSLPSPSVSTITTSSLEISNSKRLLSSAHQKPRKKSKLNSEDAAYTTALEALANSMKQPIIIKSIDQQDGTYLKDSTKNSSNILDPVDTCMAFVGSIVKRIKNEILKLDIMNTLVQTVINASTENLENERCN